MTNDAGHAGRAHARLSASKSDIWLNCPASVPLSAPFSDVTSHFAAEGTLAHELSEAWIRHELFDEPMPEIPDAFVEHIKVYVEFVAPLAKQAKWFGLEHRVQLDKLWTGQPPEQLFGTTDFVALVENKLWVCDLKYGKGVVNPNENSQLKFYALGAYLSLPDELKKDVEEISTAIIQPRAGGKAVRSYNYSPFDLLEWGHLEVVPAVEKIMQAKDLTVAAGKWCHWCLAGRNENCPEKRKTLLTKAQQAFNLPFEPFN